MNPFSQGDGLGLCIEFFPISTSNFTKLDKPPVTLQNWTNEKFL